jgi:hypothetical protein
MTKTRNIQVEISEQDYDWLVTQAQLRDEASPAVYVGRLLQQVIMALKDTDHAFGIDEDTDEGESIAKRLRALGYIE